MDRKVVLVVEDNADELMIYTTMLSHRGYAVVAATDYEAALAAARQQRPDLAVIDVNLGDASRDGCDLVSAFRRDPTTADMPIIAHTAFGDVYRRALQGSGCSDILHKPTRPDALVDAVEDLIGEPVTHPRRAVRPPGA
jgi:CheY-like chemotaxis protein